MEGVQFHPESIASEMGMRLLANFLDYKREPFAFRPLLERVMGGAPLAMEQAAELMDEITEGRLPAGQLAGILVALAVKGYTAEEIAGCASVLARKKQPLARPAGADTVVDTCGTGGDGLATFNISSLAALVVAACGVPVAKHGNRGVSSPTGSADLFAALGVDTGVSPRQAAAVLARTGFAFLFAPTYHGAMRHAAPVRAELAVKTVLNLLGPLVNPAAADCQLIGVYDGALCEPMARAARLLGVRRVLVVHGADGQDEVSVTGPTRMVEIGEEDECRDSEFDPASCGIAPAALADLQGGDAAHNAALARELLAGGGPRGLRDAVAVNAGAALYVAGAAPDIAAGYRRARTALEGRQRSRQAKRGGNHHRPPAHRAPRSGRPPPPATGPLSVHEPVRHREAHGRLYSRWNRGGVFVAYLNEIVAGRRRRVAAEGAELGETVPGSRRQPLVTLVPLPPAGSSACSAGGAGTGGVDPSTGEFAQAPRAAAGDGGGGVGAGRSPAAAGRVPGAGPLLVCEIKRRSPSRGAIAPGLDAVEQARRYAAAGVRAVSVLTEPDHFGGALADLVAVKEACPHLSVLRKDFLLDERDLEVSYRAGADAVLLLAACLSAEELGRLYGRALEMGMTPLVEVHDDADLAKARVVRPLLTGINSRDLTTFEVDTTLPARLRPAVDWPTTLLFESGIHCAEDAAFARSAGFDGVLVGEAVVRRPELVAELHAVLCNPAGVGRRGRGHGAPARERMGARARSTRLPAREHAAGARRRRGAELA